MAKIPQPSPWAANDHEALIPITHEGKIVGFCQPAYARHMVEHLNQGEQLHKALELACYDLTARSSGSAMSLEDMVQQYMAKAVRPTSGTAMVALLLRQRQEDLDLTDEEFAKFCDTFRLSRAELQTIYQDEEIGNNQLNPLARILGMTVDELIEAWRGQE